MRDVLVLGIIAVAVLVALRRPWIGVLTWVWISLMNPHRFTYGFAYDAPVAAVAALSVLVGLLIAPDRDSPFKGAPVAWLCALTVWITISWLGGLDVAGNQAQWSKVMKINLMVLVALMALRAKDHILALAWVMTLSIAMLGTKGGLFTLLNGGNYRVWGPPDSFVEGNNEFAVAVIMSIPLLRFLQLQVRNRWLSWGLLAAMVLSAASAVGSHSRGGLLAVAAMAGMFWWRGSRKLLGGVLIAAVGTLLVMFMPDSWSERMGTIQSYEEDASALGRFSAWWVSWRLAFDYPFGVGFNISRPDLFAAYSPYPQFGTPAAHSIYFQMLGHHGFVGLFLFLGLWVSTWRAAAAIRRQACEIEEARWCVQLAGLCQVSLVGYLAGGAFLQLAYFDFPYYVMVLIVLTHQWVHKRALESRSTKGATLHHAAFGRPDSVATRS